MRRTDRLDAAVILAYVVPVVGNVLIRPWLGLVQTACLVGAVLLMGLEGAWLPTGGILAVLVWLWSLWTLHACWSAQQAPATST